MIGAIWAHAGGVIGACGTLPFHVPEDLAHFQRTTLGTTVLMGRATWESLPEANRPLRGRTNIVASRNADYPAPGATVVTDLITFLSQERWRREDLWVMGGAQIYRAALPFVERAMITEVDLRVNGDTFAPDLGPGTFSCEPWALSKAGVRYRRCHWSRGETCEQVTPSAG
ncbi:MAG: dihydrofolate reductase [Bowdeniella nasicola]|nr:dihydrofolate reductase [Bowdeniella nasicola]